MSDKVYERTPKDNNKRNIEQDMLKRFYSSGLKRAKFDIKTVISKIDQYKESISNRQLLNEAELLKSLSSLPELYETWKTQHSALSEIQVQRKQFENQFKKQRGSADVNTNTANMREEIAKLKAQSQEVTKNIDMSYESMWEICDSLPNLIHASAPNTEPTIEQWINYNPVDKTTSPEEHFKADPKREHMDILRAKKLVEFQQAANVSGSSFYYLFDEAAELESALVQYAVAKARTHGFRYTVPPSIARMDVINACGFRPRDNNGENQIYQLQNTDKGLIATAEITLAGLQMNRVFDTLSVSSETQQELPLKMCGVSKSFRKEAGARGKDTKGLYRVHEFSKVEMFIWCRPEESDTFLQELKNLQVEMITELGLTGKVLNMPANDLGAPAFQKYDIECWMPGRGEFGETSSTSNCTDFQSRRMNTKYTTQVNQTIKQQYVHTLNGTAMAIPRMIVAIVENFYDPATKLVAIPKPLQKYMNNKTHF